VVRDAVAVDRLIDGLARPTAPTSTLDQTDRPRTSPPTGQTGEFRFR
jgi:hypothetical protein